MKTIFQKSFISIIFLVLIISGSCSPNNVVQTSIEVSKTPTPTNTLTATPTLENTYRTPIPTLSSSAEEQLVEIINSSDCILPCYMGITPGKTKLEDAKILLESLGAKFWAQGTQDNGKWYDYLLLVDDPSISMVNGMVEDHRISNNIVLIVIDDVVQQINVWILGQGFSSKFQDYWSRYLPKGVFLQIGVPDEIYIGKGGSLALVYEQLGIINIYETFWKDGQLCPQNETVYFDRRFILTNKDISAEIYSEQKDSLKLWSNLIEESLGVTVQEFYDQVIADDSVCFDIKPE